jgi:lipid II:glycine glycyltransferase (peptidoglycan interpeptide bridge formation enzyme)
MGPGMNNADTPSRARECVCDDCFSAPQKNLAWDRFLLDSDLGEFPQSSAWWHWKQMRGWRGRRVTLENGDGPIAGFQIFWRETRIGRIGYVSRGPVVHPETFGLTAQTVDALMSAINDLKLAVAVVQPPADSHFALQELGNRGFLRWPGTSIITSTLRIGAADGEASVMAGFNRTTVKHIRKAERSGVMIRPGNATDLELFFQLMSETCQRQRAKPNPGSPEEVREIWHSLEPLDACRLTIAEHNGCPVSALFCILFGRTFSLWKKGSSTDALHLHAMELLYREALLYAAANGFSVCDFVALRRSIAEGMLSGRKLTPEENRSRDFFNLGFGGYPFMLPAPQIYISNRLLRGCVRISADLPLLGGLVSRLANSVAF